MENCDYNTIAETAEHWATVLGIVVGGGWVLYRFGLFRKRQAALSMRLSCAGTPYGQNGQNLILAAVNATIKNTGAVMITARKQREPAYPKDVKTDPYETLNYGVSLLLRKIDGNMHQKNERVRWFATAVSKSPLPGDIELDLASGYERDGKTDFWMEPGETYRLGTAVVLERGLYLALLTLVGDKDEDDFWRSEYILNIDHQARGKCVLTPQPRS